jgi:hypothetical protein
MSSLVSEPSSTSAPASDPSPIDVPKRVPGWTSRWVSVPFLTSLPVTDPSAIDRLPNGATSASVMDLSATSAPVRPPSLMSVLPSDPSLTSLLPSDDDLTSAPVSAPLTTCRDRTLSSSSFVTAYEVPPRDRKTATEDMTLA